jgi:hypothetical protein
MASELDLYYNFIDHSHFLSIYDTNLHVLKMKAEKPYTFSFSFLNLNDDAFFRRGNIHASFHTLLLLILTCIVAILNEREKVEDLGLIAMPLWGITPLPCQEDETKCIPAFNDDIKELNNTNTKPCILNLNHKHYFYTSYGEQGADSLCNLLGKTPLYEREGVNLFSTINAPFLILSSQVLKTVFALLYVREDSLENTHSSSSNIQKTLKKMALLILITYAVSFLFMQNTWKIPGNNIFMVEIFFIYSIFLIASTSSSHISESAKRRIMSFRLLEFTLTIPLLTVPVLVASGNTSINDITVVFFTTLFANGFIVFLEIYKDALIKKNSSLNMGNIGGVILMNIWLCLIPFIMYCSISISKLIQEESKNKYYSWTMASVVVLFLYEIIYVLSITFYNLILYSNNGQRLIDSCCLPTFSSMQRLLDIISVVCITSISLCILWGSFAIVSDEKIYPPETTTSIHH